MALAGSDMRLIVLPGAAEGLQPCVAPSEVQKAVRVTAVVPPDGRCRRCAGNSEAGQEHANFCQGTICFVHATDRQCVQTQMRPNFHALVRWQGRGQPTMICTAACTSVATRCCCNSC